MGQGYLIDTNVLIDAQVGALPADGLEFLKRIIDQDFTISFVTYIEYLGYNDISSSEEQFVKLASVVGVDKKIIECCILLRQKHTIKLPDAIIAATALTRDLIVLTRNKADFSNIANLKSLDLWDLN